MRQIKFRIWDKKEKKIYDNLYLETYGVILRNEIGVSRHKDLIPMQFTGLQDKAGKDIFEGDLLKHDLWGVSEIIWEHGSFRGTSDKHDITLADHQLQRSRVIGNVYENKNLLEDKA